MWYFIILGDHYSYVIKGEPTNRGACTAFSPAVKGHLGSCIPSFVVMEHHDPGNLHMQKASFGLLLPEG